MAWVVGRFSRPILPFHFFQIKTESTQTEIAKMAASITIPVRTVNLFPDPAASYSPDASSAFEAWGGGAAWYRYSRRPFPGEETGSRDWPFFFSSSVDSPPAVSKSRA